MPMSLPPLVTASLLTFESCISLSASLMDLFASIDMSGVDIISCARVLLGSLRTLTTFLTISRSVTMPVGEPPLITMTAPMLFEAIFSVTDETVSDNNTVTGGLLVTVSTEALNPKRLVPTTMFVVSPFILSGC